MRITILLLIMREAQAFLCKYVIFRKFALKFLINNFLKISPHFLVEDAKPFFHLICELLFYCFNEGGVGFFFVSVTNGQTDGRTYTFFKSLHHTDSHGI